MNCNLVMWTWYVNLVYNWLYVNWIALCELSMWNELSTIFSSMWTILYSCELGELHYTMLTVRELVILSVECALKYLNCIYCSIMWTWYVNCNIWTVLCELSMWNFLLMLTKKENYKLNWIIWPSYIYELGNWICDL